MAIEELAKSEADEARAKNLQNLTQEITLRKNLADVQVAYSQVVHGLSKENADETRYRISLTALAAQAAAETKFGKDSVDKVKDINAQIEQLQVEHALKMSEELSAQKADTIKILDGMQKDVKASDGIEIVLPKNVQALLTFNAEAKELGVTLGVDLVQKINLAKKALADYIALGGNDAKQMDALKSKIRELQTQYSELGASLLSERMKENKAALQVAEGELAQARARGANTDAIKKEIEALKNVQGQLVKESVQLNKSKTEMEEFHSTIGSGIMQLEQGFSDAMSSMIQGQGSFARDMESSVFKMIGSMAQQWATYYLALALGNLWIDPAAAAGELAAGTALEALAGVMNGLGSKANAGGGSSSSNTYQYNNGQSNSSSTASSGRSNIGIQHFAHGGLITSPTLAMIGEGKSREAAIPLDNPEAMDTIGKAMVGAGGGGSNHFHFHAPVIGASDVAKLCGQINKRVARGQAHLNSSSTFKVTKRGG